MTISRDLQQAATVQLSHSMYFIYQGIAACIIWVVQPAFLYLFADIQGLQFPTLVWLIVSLVNFLECNNELICLV